MSMTLRSGMHRSNVDARGGVRVPTLAVPPRGCVHPAFIRDVRLSTSASEHLCDRYQLSRCRPCRRNGRVRPQRDRCRHRPAAGRDPERGSLDHLRGRPGAAAGTAYRQWSAALHHRLREIADWADVHFLCVGTPQSATGAADLSQVFSAIDTLAPLLTGKPTVIAGKSTVPVGTAMRIQERLNEIARSAPTPR